MRVIGLDIGGANLKASDGERLSVTRAFPLWQHPAGLGDALQSLLSEFARPQHLTVTMTGELADCFATKAEGVQRILESLTAVVDVPVHVWQRSGEFVSPEEAAAFPMLTAAANWHALATWAGRMMPQGCALLIDMGSTTTDIIPLVDGLPQTQGGTDLERLAAGELVYNGCRRTPVCAVAQSVLLPASMGTDGSPADVPLLRPGTSDRPPATGTACPAEAVPTGNDAPNSAGQAVARRSSFCREIPLAAELFATMHDVALILGDAEEDATNVDTADGRPATIDHARSRLARMLCCDRTELADDQLTQIAVQLRNAQYRQVEAALTRVRSAMPTPPASLLLSGEGERIIQRLIEKRVIAATVPLLSLHDSLGAQHSTAACAYALARLGTERIR